MNATTGKEVYKTKLGDITKGETITMAPLVVKDKVLVGNSGGEFGVRGWLIAVDAHTGKLAWRAYSTGPDKEVLIGPRFKPFYASDKGQDLGVKTWPPDAWKIGGGTVWGWISYDPDTNLIFYGTANPGPWNADERPGDNKWTAGIFARDADTGEAVWYYQYSQHDLFDYDGVNENLLLELPINGQQRKVIVHPDRNGYVYVLDRATGQPLSASPFAYVNTSKGVDLKSGLLQYNDEKKPKFGSVTREICPTAPGRQRLAALRVLTQNRLAVHASQQSLYGRRGCFCQLHRGNTIRGRERKNVCRARGTWRRIHGVGSGQWQSGLENQGPFPSMERRAGYCRRCSFLWHAWMVTSRPSMPKQAKSSGNSRPVRESSASQLHIEARMESSM